MGTSLVRHLLATALSTLLSVLLISAGVALVTSPATAARPAEQSCKFRHPFLAELKQTNTTCPKAKRLAQAWLEKASYDEAFVDDRVRVRGYLCIRRDDGRVRCRDDAKRVRFVHIT